MVMVAERGTTRRASAIGNENENEKRSEQRNEQDASVTRRDWRNTRAAVTASIRIDILEQPCLLVLE